LKSKDEILFQTKVADSKKDSKKYYTEEDAPSSIAADPIVAYMSKEELTKLADKTKKQMERAAKDLDFIEAARLRDELLELKKMVETR